MDADFFAWLQSETGREWFERLGVLDLVSLAEYFRTHENTVQSYLVDVSAIERECHPSRVYADAYCNFFKGARYLHEGRERAKRLTVKLNEARRRGEVFPKGFRDWWEKAWDADVAAGGAHDE